MVSRPTKKDLKSHNLQFLCQVDLPEKTGTPKVSNRNNPAISKKILGPIHSTRWVRSSVAHLDRPITPRGHSLTVFCAVSRSYLGHFVGLTQNDRELWGHTWKKTYQP